MSDEQAGDSLREQRLQKLGRLKQSGVDPWPTRFHRTHTAEEARATFREDETQTASVALAGRLVALRDIGKLSFAHLQDGTGRIQLSFQVDDLAGRYQDLRDLDIGDFIGVNGYLWRTKRGEITVRVQEYQLLAKSLRPLPEKWHGLTDIEKRYRQRYLDLIGNDEVRQVFQRRSALVSAMRKFLEDRGFLEVETPVLQPLYGGAAARPFLTHHHALDRDLYLRISDELYLKRLIIGGFDKVYEISKDFRNEGIDTRHNPEFTMMELYQAYADLGDILDLTEAMVRNLCHSVADGGSVEFNGQTIDYDKPFRKVTVRDAILDWGGIDIQSASLEELAGSAKLPVAAGRAKLIDELLGLYVEPKLVQPTFLLDWPVELSPLAKRKRDDPGIVERFELIVAGMEIANAFSELNDPLDQRDRFKLLAQRRAAGDEEAAPVDEEFLEAMEYGMPPTGGLGVGIDRLVMLLTGQTSIREVILFPQLRSQPQDAGS